MSDQQPAFVPEVEHLRGFDWAIIGPVQQGAQKAPRLTFGVYRGKPNISVRTNAPADQGNDKGLIRAEPSNPDFYAFLAALEHIARTPGEQKYTATLKARQRGKGGQLSEEKRPAVHMIIGRDQNEVVYIAIRHWNKDRPVIKFPILPINDNFSEVVWGDAQGNPLSNGAISSFHTLGWIEALKQHLPVATRATYQPPKPREGYGGGNGGGGGGGGYGGGGGNRGGGGGYGGGGQGGGGYNNNRNQGGGGGGGDAGGGGGDFSGFSDADDLPL